MKFLKNNFSLILKVSSVSLVATVAIGASFFVFTKNTEAVSGINRTMNFQGKLVNNPIKTNVTDTSYTVVFTLYDRASGGTVLWTETQTVTTADGIFRVALGSVTAFPANFNFNWDGIYLGMKVNADNEMTPRIQLAAVPYAFNSEKVAGLTVQDDAGNASTSATLRIANAKTVTISNGLTFAGTDSTTITFQGSDTYVGRITTDILTNKTIGSTGLIFSGAGTDMTTAANEDFVLTPNGTGKVGINAAIPLAGIDLRSSINTLAVASVSGSTPFAVLLVDQRGTGDIFTASTGGVSKFIIQNNGTLVDSNYSGQNGVLYGTQNTGVIAQATTPTSNLCLLSGASAPAWGSCSTGANFWQLNSNVISQNNNTYDVMFGGTATSSSRFAFIGNAGNATPVASISANSGANSTFLTGLGNLGTTNKQTLTFGGSTTGLIQVNNAAGSPFTTFDTVNSRVGIGISNPSYQLHIRGAGNQRVIVEATDSNSAQVDLYNPTASWSLYNDSSTGQFRIYNQGDRLSVTSGGSVGIGTSSMLGSLDVRPNITNGGTISVASVSGSTSFAGLLVDNTGTGDLFTASKSGATKLRVTNSGDLVLSGALNFGGTSGSSSQCLLGGSAASWGACGSSNWTLNSSTGVIRPNNNTLDLILGGTSTASAKFQFTNLISGNPTFKVFDSASLRSVNIFHDGTNGYIQTSAGELVLGNGASDLIIENAISNDTTNNSGAIKISDKLLVQNSESVIALAIFDNTGAGDILAASASGVTKFALTNSGAFNIGGSYGSLGECLKSGGSAASILTWGVCSNSAGTWVVSSNGTHSPINNTLDLLIGSTATASAKFGILNVNGSLSPIASISATTASGGNGSGLVLDTSTSSIQSLRKNTLTLGGSTTGNIQFNPGGVTSPNLFLRSNGDIGVNTINTLASMDVRANTVNSGGTLAIASISGTTSFAGLLVDNTGTGDLFTASKSGATKFVIKNDGTIGFDSTTYSNCAIINTGSNGSVACGSAGGSEMISGSTYGGNSDVTFLAIPLNITMSVATVSATPTSNFADVYVRSSLSLYSGSNTDQTITLSLRKTNCSGPVLSTNTTAITLASGAFSQVIELSGVDNNPGIATTNYVICESATGAASSVGNRQIFAQVVDPVGPQGLTGGDTLWQLSSGGVLNPTNLTTDILFGGISTSAAKFGFLNVAGGTPTASISANSGNTATYLTGDGTLSTTNNATLTLGGGFSGNVQINHLAGAFFSVGTSSPLASVDLRYAAGTNAGGIIAVASISGKTSFAGLVVDNSGVGDIFTASTSGKSKFTVGQNLTKIETDSIIALGSGLTGSGSNGVLNAIGDQGSLVPNSSFEVATGSGSFTQGVEFAAGWVMAATSSSAFRVDTSTAGHGELSIKASLTTKGGAFYSSCIPISSVSNNYTLSWQFKVATGVPVPTIRTNLDQYTTRANCTSNTSGTSSTTLGSTIIGSASWQFQSGTPTITAGTQWARVHFYVACNVNCIAYIDGVRLTQAAATTGLDLAENYTGDIDNLAQPGDVVMMKQIGGKTIVVPSDQVYGKSVIGVVTTKPGLVLDDSIDSPKIAVALAGRVPVKVSTINGEIKVGDELTSSNIPGVAVKAIKSGQIIGVAMEDYSDSENIGQIVMFIKNVYSENNSVANSLTNVDFTSNNFGQEVLDQLKSNSVSSASGLVGSNTFADRLIASIEIVAPKITVDTLYAKNIKADNIEGLNSINKRLDDLDAKIATIGATLTPQTPEVDKQAQLMQRLTEQLESATKSSTMTQNNTFLSSISVSSSSSTSGSLRVKGNGLIEGILNVIDTITTNNLILNGLATFFGDVVFKAKITFEGPVTFSNDSGGTAIINKNEKSVNVVFDTEFDETPVVNVSVAFDQARDKNGNIISSKEAQEAYFAENYAYIIGDKSKKGFVIVLNKKAKNDIPFTWSVLRVKDAKTIQSRLINSE